MTRKQLVTQVQIIANHVARRSPDYAQTLRETATLLEHEDMLVERARAIADVIVFNRGGLGVIRNQEVFAEYFFAYVAVEKARVEGGEPQRGVQIRCAACGEGGLESGTRFCPHCGNETRFGG